MYYTDKYAFINAEINLYVIYLLILQIIANSVPFNPQHETYSS